MFAYYVEIKFYLPKAHDWRNVSEAGGILISTLVAIIKIILLDDALINW